MNLARVTPIDAEAILPMAESRASLNLTAADSFHDTRVNLARNLGIDFAERYTGIVFVQSQFRWSIGHLTPVVHLPRRPVVSVDALAYLDTGGAQASLLSTDWYLARDQLSPVHGTQWPTGSDIRIDFTAGHALAANAPAMLKAGAIVAMAAYFADQETPDLTGAKRCLDLVREAAL